MLSGLAGKLQLGVLETGPDLPFLPFKYLFKGWLVWVALPHLPQL